MSGMPAYGLILQTTSELLLSPHDESTQDTTTISCLACVGKDNKGSHKKKKKKKKKVSFGHLPSAVTSLF